MRNNTNSQSGFFNPRVFAAFLLGSAGVWLALVSFATPAPTSDTLTLAHSTITYTDSLGAPLNPTPIATGMPTCGVNDAACSVFTLNIGSDVNASSGNQVLVEWQWGNSTVDYDWFIEDKNGTVIARNQSTADPSAIVLPLPLNNGPYKLIGTLSTGAPIPYTGTVILQKIPTVGPGICSGPNCAPPRFESYPAGPGQSDDAGEPSIGVDWNPNLASLQHGKVNTGGVTFFTSSNHQWRVNFDDSSSPAVNLWEDVSSLFDQQFVLTDPIGWVDHFSTVQLGLTYPEPHTPGRVFGMDLIGGQGNSFSAFSDNDGGTAGDQTAWTPGGNGGPGQGPDHETIGGGPYSGSPPPTKTSSYPNAIYYCSQNIVAEAQCSRSDDGGQTFGPGIPIFTATQCTGGIHGHVKVARDGTVYVPNSSCGTDGTDGVAVSTDNGLSWTERNVPDSNGSHDPSLGVGMNNVGKPGNQPTSTIYLGYADGDNHPKVAVSHDRGVTWSTPVDVGTPFGVKNSVFPTVVAGDDNRAAFAFVGTGAPISTDDNTCDPFGATLNCANIWHLYVATTYDGGQSWITVDATPDDPVQTGVVCLAGTTCLSGRNLLDFNDSTVDSQGRILFGFADGCVGCANIFHDQSNASHGTVLRQSGGRRLFAHFDTAEPAAPAAPQMVSANRSGVGADVVWLQPDNGGAAITGYNVYRGTTSGGETFLANVTGGATTTKYFDPNPPAGKVFYYVTAVNGQGEGGHAPEISLAGAILKGDACTFPYLQVDPAGSTGQVSDPTPNGEMTIKSVNIGEPFTTCADNSITYVMKVKSLDPSGMGTALLPQNAEYQILFTVTDTANHTHTVFVELDTFSPNSQALPGVSLGRRDPCSAGCGTFDSSLATSPVTASFSADGTIVLKLDTSNAINFPAPSTPGTGAAFTWDPHAVGTQMTNITGNTLLFVGAGAGFLETVSTTSGGSYTRAGNGSCSTAIPIADLGASTLSGNAPLNVNFDGTGSHEPDGGCATINSYTIDYGDGPNNGSDTQTNNNGLFSHQFSAPGTYTVQLSVTDTNGKASTNTAQQVITVIDNAPSAGLNATPSSGNAPLNVSFDASGSTDPDAGDGISSYTFNFGDGTPTVTQSGAKTSHIYNNAGSYNASVTVEDHQGVANTNTAQVPISVTNNTAKPDLVVSALSVSPTSPVHGNLATITATVKNQGTANAGTSKTRFLDGNTVLGLVNTPGLASGASTQVSIGWTPSTAGRHTVKAKADQTKAVAESNETNNLTKAAVKVQ
jgi:PKD repeat protein